MKKLPAAILCIALFAAMVFAAFYFMGPCRICGGDHICDACGGTGHQNQTAFDTGEIIQIACPSGCSYGLCPECVVKCKTCQNTGNCPDCGGTGYLRAGSYQSGEEVSIACTGAHCASGRCADCIIVFVDPVIEQAVREKLSRPIGAVTYGDLQKVTDLTIERRDTEKREKASLVDLRHMTNLETLVLYQCGIADISGLSGVTGLKTLILTGNFIEDISALSG